MPKNSVKNLDTHDMFAKVILIGDSSVGKTSILNRYYNDNFNESLLLTVGVDFRVKNTKMNNLIIKYHLWDIGGREHFKSMLGYYYRDANIILLVFDITKYETFVNIKDWSDEVDKYVNSHITKILIGNKLDLESERKVSFQEAYMYARSLEMEYIETSAKNSLNLSYIFNMIGRKTIENKQITEQNKKYKLLINLEEKHNKKKYC
jgi:small GTP-binding protein